jgi:hypothetical protein
MLAKWLALRRLWGKTVNSSLLLALWGLAVSWGGWGARFCWLSDDSMHT